MYIMTSSNIILNLMQTSYYVEVINMLLEGVVSYIHVVAKNLHSHNAIPRASISINSMLAISTFISVPQ